MGLIFCLVSYFIINHDNLIFQYYPDKNKTQDMAHKMKNLWTHLIRIKASAPMHFLGGLVSNGPLWKVFYSCDTALSQLRLMRTVLEPDGWDTMNVYLALRLIQDHVIKAVETCGHIHAKGTATYLRYFFIQLVSYNYSNHNSN